MPGLFHSRATLCEMKNRIFLVLNIYKKVCIWFSDKKKLFPKVSSPRRSNTCASARTQGGLSALRLRWQGPETVRYELAILSAPLLWPTSMPCLNFRTLIAFAHISAPYSRIKLMVNMKSYLACGPGPRVFAISWLSWPTRIDAFSVVFRIYSANVSFVSIVTPRYTAKGFNPITYSLIRIGTIILICFPDSITISVFARASWSPCFPI